MTLIKCFTDSHIDNISPCLRQKMEHMILLGDAPGMEQAARRYRALLKKRGLPTKVSILNTGNHNFDDLCETLYRLVLREEVPVIDLTGGDEEAVMSVGAVVARLEPDMRKKIRVERFDPEKNTVLDCLTGKTVSHPRQPKLWIDELIALHGGVLCEEAYQPPEGCTPKDIEKVWKLSAKDPTAWNSQIKILREFERHSCDPDKNHIQVELSNPAIAALQVKLPPMREFLEVLQRNDILTNRSCDSQLNYTYKNPLMRLCTEKAGNVLELKTVLEARCVMEGDAPFFHDCRMSVDIDWDGVLHDPKQQLQETRNEIDVVLMHGCTPLFISCKNGNIQFEELYKLHTVTQRFGGNHAGKMLIASKLNRKSDAANESFTQRAWDMDIFLVTNAAKRTAAQWAAGFQSALP